MWSRPSPSPPRAQIRCPILSKGYLGKKYGVRWTTVHLRWILDLEFRCTHLPHAESQVSVLGLKFAVVGLDEHALVAPRRLPRVKLLAVQQLVVGGDDALGGNSIG